MQISWLWLWLVFMFVFLILPTSYGWGYRGWGPPYPRYMQRRRGDRAASSGSPTSFNHHAWGLAGDVFWLLLIFWVLTFFWVR
ncbi:MAG: hypothetical protein ACYCVE_04200 [Gemmatimonadaceae bacterium]